MRVNAVFTGFFTNPLVMRVSIAMVMLIVFFITPSFREHSDRELRAKEVNLIIRQIGHQLLLQAGDSTSRVLPVTEIKEGTFLLRFENEFVFNHDSLVVMSQDLLPKTRFPSGYTVTVHDCMKSDIVYGFQLNNTSPDLLACSGRSQPQGCYTIEFAFADLYAAVKQKKTGVNQMGRSAKVDPQDVNPKPEELKTATFDYGIDHTPEDLKSAPPDVKMTTSNFPLTNVVFTGMLVLLCVTLLIWRFGKKPVPVQNQNQESVPALPALGKFFLNVKGQHLLLGSEIISLTDKECKVLELLHKGLGELIPRETLMQEVWISEGVITGRSLDMFVSKLRKKLSGDPELRITNIHGKGYKLEINPM